MLGQNGIRIIPALGKRSQGSLEQDGCLMSKFWVQVRDPAASMNKLESNRKRNLTSTPDPRMHVHTCVCPPTDTTCMHSLHIHAHQGKSIVSRKFTYLCQAMSSHGTQCTGGCCLPPLMNRGLTEGWWLIATAQ